MVFSEIYGDSCDLRYLDNSVLSFVMLLRYRILEFERYCTSVVHTYMYIFPALSRVLGKSLQWILVKTSNFQLCDNTEKKYNCNYCHVVVSISVKL